jgi:hypothetical protein
MSNLIYVPSIIDVEASGFGANSYPIEIGVTLSSDVRSSMLIKPEPDWLHWDNHAQKLHGIERCTLETTGRSIGEVAAHFNTLLAGQQLYSDGWSVDKPWICKLFHAAHVPMQFSVHPIEQIMCESQFDVWDATKQQLMNQASHHRHRASHDALIIQQTYIQTRAMVSGADTEEFRVANATAIQGVSHSGELAALG